MCQCKRLHLHHCTQWENLDQTRFPNVENHLDGSPESVLLVSVLDVQRVLVDQAGVQQWHDQVQSDMCEAQSPAGFWSRLALVVAWPSEREKHHRRHLWSLLLLHLHWIADQGQTSKCHVLQDHPHIVWCSHHLQFPNVWWNAPRWEHCFSIHGMVNLVNHIGLQGQVQSKALSSWGHVESMLEICGMVMFEHSVQRVVHGQPGPNAHMV